MEKRDFGKTRDSLGKTNGRWRDGVYRKECGETREKQEDSRTRMIRATCQLVNG